MDPNTVVDFARSAESLGIIGILFVVELGTLIISGAIIKGLLARLDTAYVKLEAANAQLIAMGPQFMERSLTALSAMTEANRETKRAVETMTDVIKEGHASRQIQTEALASLDRKVEAMSVTMQMLDNPRRALKGS